MKPRHPLPVGRQIMASGCPIIIEGGPSISQVANRAGMLHQMPPFLGALRTMEGGGGTALADAFIVVTLDGAAQELCLQLHLPKLCVADDWNTTGLGTP